MAFTIRRDFLWLLVSQGIFAAFQFLIVVVLAHGGGLEHIGYYSFALALLVPIQIFCNFSLRTVFVTDRKSNFDFNYYWQLRLLGSIIALVAALIFSLILSIDKVQFIVVLLVAVAKVSQSMADIIYACPQKNNKIELVGKSTIFHSSTSTLSFSIVYLISNDLILSLVFYTIPSFLVLFFYDHKFLTPKEWYPKFISSDIKHLVKLTHLALPLGIASSLTALSNSIPRLTLEQYYGTSELGIFTALGYFVILVNLAINAFGQVVRVPLSVAFHARNYTRFWGIIGAGCVLAVGMGVGLFLVSHLFGEQILTLIYGSQMADYGSLLRLVGLVSTPIFLGGFLGFCLPSTESYKLTLVTSLITFIGTILASSIYIPIYGITGAIYATACFGILSCLQLGAIVWKWNTS